ncbi:MAG: hypothetical protein K0S16_486 [Moraxellaceae bacterium]|nr:hypothetical protein [Moraxellaceae bacterium]
MGRASHPFRVVVRLAVSLAALALAACAAKPVQPQCYHSPWLARYACEPRVIAKVPYATLKKSLTEYFEQKKQEGVLIDAGMYFRDLEDGPHFGVNEYANFAAGSLLKLPLVMQYLSLAEEDPALLKLRLKVPDQIGILYDVVYLPPERLVPGESHSVEELMRRTVQYSDNMAYMMLRQYLIDRYGNESFLWESYRQLGLVPDVADRTYVISVARYSSLFKLLYSAAYLNAEKSEKLVQIMLGTTFSDGLERGVPPEVRVAHKHGERERDGIAQLNDCGIIYFPDNPYILCVMTRGTNNDALEKVIGDVSRMVYEEVQSRRGRHH